MFFPWYLECLTRNFTIFVFHIKRYTEEISSDLLFLGHKFRSQLCFYFPGILSLQVRFLWSAEVRGCCMVTGRGAHLYLQHWPYDQLLHKPLLWSRNLNSQLISLGLKMDPRALFMPGKCLSQSYIPRLSVHTLVSHSTRRKKTNDWLGQK